MNKLTIPEFKEYVTTEKLKVLHSLKLKQDDIYYNTSSAGIGDEKYDILKDTLIKRDPTYIPPVGAPVRKGEKRVTLPVWMGSMDKLSHTDDKQTTKEIEKWVKENPAKAYNISAKLDGVSCLAVIGVGTNNIKVYTRGDGVIGTDISHIAKYLNIPANITKRTVVRGELIIPKKRFESVYSSLYKNARNAVTGIISLKKPNIELLTGIDLVIYEDITQDNLSPTDQLENLSNYSLKNVKHEQVTTITTETLIETFLRFHEEYDYEIDGIIVQSDIPHTRNISGNPKYAFAFKMRLDSNIATTTVLKVDWNISRWGKIIPRIFVEPVELSGVTITKATAFNARYVEDNKIGVGTVIEITRSGDVIPFIVRVVKSSKEPDMPDITYTWDETHVNIMAESDNITCIKSIARFFAKLNILHVAEKTVEKLYASGFNDLGSIISASEEDLIEKAKMGEKSANRIVTNINKGLRNIKITDALAASSVLGYGIGKKRIEALFKDIPDILSLYKDISPEKLKERIVNIEGFSDKTSDVIVHNIKFADTFINNLGKVATFKKVGKIKGSTKSVGTLTGNKYLLTGFRDAKLVEDITNSGGEIMSTLSGKTSAVIIKEGGGKTGKPLKAKSMGIPVYNVQEFRREFLTN